MWIQFRSTASRFRAFVLELFVEKYLKPKYPDIGIDSRFALPARVDSADRRPAQSHRNPEVG